MCIHFKLKSLYTTYLVEMFSFSERAVYITGKESWSAYLRAYLSEQGWGDAAVLLYDSSSYDTTLTFCKSSITPFSIGLVAAIWERAHGRKFHLTLSGVEQAINVNIRSLLEYENES